MSDTPLGAIHRITETLKPYQQLRGGEEIPEQLSLNTAFVKLTSELRSTKQILGQAGHGHGLATLWWCRLVRQCEAIESAIQEYDGDWGRLHFCRDGLFDWLRREAELVSVALTSMANGAISGPSVAGLLDDSAEQGALDRLRTLAVETQVEFDAAPDFQSGAMLRSDRHEARQQWRRRRDEIFNIAGRLVLEAVNSNQVAAEHYRDQKFANVLLRQLVLDYSQPECGLIQQIDGADCPEGLLRLADWLADDTQPAKQPEISTEPNLIDRLLSGPEDVELTAKELALLEAHLKQPRSLAAMQQETQTTGRSASNERRNQLKLIHDYNRNLQKLKTTAESGEDDNKTLLPEQPAGEDEGVGGAETEAKRPTVNDRMKAEMTSDMETVKGWTAKQWAEKLGCGQTTIKDTETWKSLALLRQQAKAEKRQDRHHR